MLVASGSRLEFLTVAFGEDLAAAGHRKAASRKTAASGWSSPRLT